MRHTTLLRSRYLAAAAVLAATLSSGCSAPAAQDTAPTEVDLTEVAFQWLDDGNVELVDLSYPLSPDSLYWPTGAPFEHEYTGGMSDGGYWYASGAFASPEHLGTHLDAPIHFGEGKWTNVDIPLERLFGRGAVIDISAAAASDPDAVLTVADIQSWESRNGELAAGTIVIVRSGWAQRWPDWNAYYGTETPQDVTTLHFPGVSAEAAEMLVARAVAGVGIDTASIDPGISADFRAHQVLAAANIFNLENLSNVADLPETGFGIIAMPMKIDEGTGGPARVVAVVPR